jgi:Ca2+/Na+ antiporter
VGTLLHYCAGAILCIGLGSVGLIFRIKLRRGAGAQYETIDAALALVVLAIGIGYAVLAVRQFLIWQEENRPRRRKRRRE